MQQFLKSMKPSEKLKKYREGLGLNPHDLAKAAGISSAQYYDLEGFDDLENAISLGHIAALASSLKIKTSALFCDETPSEIITPIALASDLNAFMARRKIAVSEAGNEIGWALEGFVDDPNTAVLKWNVTCLRDVCSALGRSWLAVLNGIDGALAKIPPDGQS